MFPTPDGHLSRGFTPGVDPSDARLELLDHPVALVDVLPEHAGGQAEFGVVRPRDGLLKRRVRQDAHDGPEDFLLDDPHVVRAVREHGRRHPVSIFELRGQVRRSLVEPTAKQSCPVHRRAVPDVLRHLLVVGIADQRTKVCVHVHQIACSDLFDLLEQDPFELRLQRVGHKHPRAVRADLTRAEKVGHHGAVDGLVDVGVRQDHDRTLPAQFHGHVLHLARRGTRHFSSRRHLAREADLGDVGVLGEV